jgi:hypothetical protein
MKKNIYIIPTKKPSRLKQEFYSMASYSLSRLPLTWRFAQHIYITSNDTPKEDDWCLDEKGNIIKADKDFIFNCSHEFDEYWRKIILTTDADLIAGGVEAIDDDFLEWFVNNPSCEEVEVESGLFFYAEREDRRYKIIIPQEEPKQECTCGVCDNCEEQETTQILKEAKENALKQKTLEEFIDKVDTPSDFDQFTFDEGIRVGAKWQQERMYSDIELFTEELKDKIDSFEYSVNQNSYISDYIKEWFEQFKKK